MLKTYSILESLFLHTHLTISSNDQMCCYTIHKIAWHDLVKSLPMTLPIFSFRNYKVRSFHFIYLLVYCVYKTPIYNTFSGASCQRRQSQAMGTNGNCWCCCYVVFILWKSICLVNKCNKLYKKQKSEQRREEGQTQLSVHCTEVSQVEMFVAFIFEAWAVDEARGSK